MRPTTLLTPLLPWLILLASCSTPPKPPSVDESRKRPVNAAMAVDLQVCRNDLQNTRLEAVERSRLAEAGKLANIAVLRQAVATLQAQFAPSPQANSIFTIRFDYGSTKVDVPPATADALVKAAKAAPLVLLRGRTDGIDDAPVESRIARARAASVRDYLVAAGVDAAQIRATYQPIGDHVADNASSSGRTLNRRVEIEIYRAMPVALNSHEQASATAH